jgi:hypothetical protein
MKRFTFILALAFFILSPILGFLLGHLLWTLKPKAPKWVVEKFEHKPDTNWTAETNLTFTIMGGGGTAGPIAVTIHDSGSTITNTAP